MLTKQAHVKRIEKITKFISFFTFAVGDTSGASLWAFCAINF